MYSFPDLEPVCSMSDSNCCFLTCIQISQKAGQVVWYSHLLKNFPHLVVIHIVKVFGVVNKAEVDVFLELSCFFDDPEDVGNLISGQIQPQIRELWLVILASELLTGSAEAVTLCHSSATPSASSCFLLPTPSPSTFFFFSGIDSISQGLETGPLS